MKIILEFHNRVENEGGSNFHPHFLLDYMVIQL